MRASTALHADWVQPPADAAAFASWRRRLRGPRHFGFLICDRADDSLVGVVNVNELVRGAFQSGYLGYYGFAPGVGRGGMTEGIALAITHAFEVQRLHRLEANVQPNNERSLALVRRLGFRREGFSPRYLEVAGDWRDHERWTVLSEDWSGAPGAARTA